MKGHPQRIMLALLFAALVLGSCDTMTTYVTRPSYPHLWPSPIRRPFIVLMCKFADVPDEPSAVMDQARLFLTSEGAGLGNMLDYYSDVSYGAVSLEGTRVTGKWYQAPLTQTQLPGPGNRAERAKECADAVPPSDVDFSRYYGVIAVWNVRNDGGACYDGQGVMSIHGQNYPLACVVFDPYSFYTAFAGHEVGHALGMPHSYDNTQHICGNGAKPGEYCDPWDIMSALATYQFAGPNFPARPNLGFRTWDGPGPNAPNMLQMGWIPKPRIGTHVAGATTTTYKLAALSHPAAQGFLTVSIHIPLLLGPITVEYRQQDGWDAGIPDNTVLIHEFRQGGSPNAPYSFLQRTASKTPGEVPPGTGWTDPTNQVQVCVYSIDPTAATATITVGPAGPNPSLFGCSSAPRVQILAPASGSHVTAGVPFQLVARATTWDGTPLPDASVTWQDNGHAIGSGHALTTALSTPGAGTTITVTGTDPGNSLSATDSITLFVDPPAPPPAKPTVTILSPTTGAAYDITGLTGSLTLALSSQASAGVATYAWSDSLALFTDSQANDTLTLTPAVAQISCNVSFTDVITLTVTDSHGQTASASVTVTIYRVCLT